MTSPEKSVIDFGEGEEPKKPIELEYSVISLLLEHSDEIGRGSEVMQSSHPAELCSLRSGEDIHQIDVQIPEDIEVVDVFVRI